MIKEKCNGNCKESSGQEGCCKEGSGKESRGQEARGEEGRSEEGSGEEGSGEEGRGEEGSGEEGRSEEGRSEEDSGEKGCCEEGPRQESRNEESSGEEACCEESREKAGCQGSGCCSGCSDPTGKDGAQPSSCMAVPDGHEALIGSVLTLQNPASAGFFHGQVLVRVYPEVDARSVLGSIQSGTSGIAIALVADDPMTASPTYPIMSTPLFETTLTSVPLLARGKVRDNYQVGDDRLLMIATDRLSAFDVVMGEPIPGKGELLTQIALYWFSRLADIVPNHLTGDDPESVVWSDERQQVHGRSMLVKRLRPLPVEAVVRGYLAGSGWKEYESTQSICGVHLPVGLRNASKLPEPIFTPATKAGAGAHDENISFERMCEVTGGDLATRVRDISIRLYTTAAAIAQSKGMIIADTKFEFGLDSDGTLTLMDEVLTPDSSRYWPIEAYTEGANPPSFDKQFVRDWLEHAEVNGQPWDKRAPAPALPADVVARTAAKYREASDRLLA